MILEINYNLIGGSNSINTESEITVDNIIQQLKDCCDNIKIGKTKNKCLSSHNGNLGKIKYATNPNYNNCALKKLNKLIEYYEKEKNVNDVSTNIIHKIIEIFNIIKSKIFTLDLRLSPNYTKLLKRIDSIIIKLVNKLKTDLDNKKCDCNMKGIKDIFIEDKNLKIIYIDGSNKILPLPGKESSSISNRTIYFRQPILYQKPFINSLVQEQFYKNF